MPRARRRVTRTARAGGRSRPVEVEVDEIHVVVRLSEDTSSQRNEDASARYAELTKQASIAAAELAKRAAEREASGPGASMLQRLLTRALSFLKVNVEDIHVRVEASPPRAPSLTPRAAGSSDQRARWRRGRG